MLAKCLIRRHLKLPRLSWMAGELGPRVERRPLPLVFVVGVRVKLMQDQRGRRQIGHGAIRNVAT